MGTIALTIGTPAYGISKKLVERTQQTLNENNSEVQTTHHLYAKQKIGKLNPPKFKYLPMYLNLYPSVPLDKHIKVIIEFL